MSQSEKAPIAGNPTQHSALGTQHSLILASASPRRRELLGRLGLPFVIVPSDVDETLPAGLEPARAAEGLAIAKARAVAAAHRGGQPSGRTRSWCLTTRRRACWASRATTT